MGSLTYLDDDNPGGKKSSGSLTYLDEKSSSGASLTYLDTNETANGSTAEERSVADLVGDIGVTALKGAIGLPEAVVGLADIPTGGRVGKSLEAIGYRPAEAKQILDSLYSPAQQVANRNVQQADGFVDTLAAAAQNPSTIAIAAGESLPSMIGGAGIARGLLSAAPRIGAVAAGALGEGVIAGGSAAESIRGQAKDGLITPAQSAAAVASGAGTSLLGFAGGKLAQRLGIGDIDTILASGKGQATAKGFARQVVESGVSEGAFEELPQSTQEKMWENFALGKPINEGVGNAAAMGLLSGAAMGGAGGGYNAYIGRDDQPAIPNGDGITYQPGLAPAASAAEVLGAPLPPEQTQAEKALYETKSLTALDRVAEIDQQLPNATAEEAAVIQQERESITKTWPSAVPGARSSFTTESGARLDATYSLMDAGDLVTSHDENLRPSANYPAELQPRERERHASEMQVSGIVQKLDPARLGLSADAATGAPIVGADGLVESGNARTIALKRVYQANGQKAENYKQFLKDNAEQFGITPESVDAMQKPVLVRVRNTPVNRAEFARQANASTVAQMSPGETAKADAARMDVLDDLRPDENGDFATSRDFIRRFMSSLPGTEQAGMMDAAGQLSQSGYARIRNAVLAKAYGDSPVLSRMVESMDDNLRNVGKALVAAAPAVAKVRQSIAEGVLFDVDITPDLMAAVEELSRIKDSGQSLTEALAQSGMFGERYSQETKDLIQFLADNIRRPRAMAEFIQGYMGALTEAGNPNQGSIFGETTAPSKPDLLKAAKGQNDGRTAENTSGRQPAGNKSAGDEGGKRSPDAPGDTGSAQGNEAPEETEWVAFPEKTGTLGIPRSEMPQVKGDARGALIQFLEARGITNKTVDDYPSKDLKPTQAEFSTKKTESWGDTRDGTDRSVLISSDGYVLDGHHQWIAALALDEPIKAIQFSAPIKDLLAAVHQFPSTRRSGGATSSEHRAKAREDFETALTELGAFFRQLNPGVRMLNAEEKARLMPALVKLFEAGIKEVGYNIKDLMVYVKKALRTSADSWVKQNWNKADDATYKAAASQAVDKAIDTLAESPRQGGLFGQNEDPYPEDFTAADKKVMSEKAPDRAARITAIEHLPAPDTFVPEKILSANKEFLKGYQKPTFTISDQARARAEALIKPLIEQAEKNKEAFDSAVMDIAHKAGIGYLIPNLKNIGRAAEKLVNEYQFHTEQMRDLLRATIVVNSYADAQAVLDEMAKQFNVSRINNRTSEKLTGDRVANKGPLSTDYQDVLCNVILDDGMVAEIQINVPEMIAAKEADGHKLYELQRPILDMFGKSDLGDKNYQALEKAQHKFYGAAFDAATRRDSETPRMKYASSQKSPLAGNPPTSESVSPLSDNKNTLPSGNLTKSSALALDTNAQPGGNLAGTFISSTSEQSIAKSQMISYTEKRDKSIGGNNEHRKPRSGSAAGKESSALFPAEAGGNADGVRAEDGRGNQRADRDPVASDRQQEGVLQAAVSGSPGKSRDNEHGRQAGKRDRAERNAGIPAGRDIPAKSGRNYAFGDGDLTYSGSWFVKAKQNVDAVELLKKLQSEGRQATREEQSILAKFIGWGSSELANTLFGNKIDKAVVLIEQYDRAIKAFADSGSRVLYQRNAGFYQAFGVLKAKNDALQYYGTNSITRDQLEAAKPDTSLSKWADLRDRLKSAMTEEEWNAASQSTQYAHYTSKPVVKALLSAVEKMGFKGGTILEPGAGIGIFPGLMNSAMATNSVYTGVEFEPVTGGILKQLFPDERILVESFIDSKLPANYYDVAFGNPPFSGSVKVLGDPKYAKQAFALHDYFFAKSMDSVKPGGLLVFVTSRYTMDKQGDKARTYLADRADLVGAIRLPQTAFTKNAGTEVVTDVLFLRKKVPGQAFEQAQSWLKLGEVKTDKDPAMVNEYFAAHPEMVLGEHARQGSMYSKDEYTVTPRAGDIEEQFRQATENLPTDIFAAGRGSAAEAAKVRDIDFNPKAQKEGSYYVSDAGILMQREGGVGVRAEEKSQKNAEVIKDFIALRDAVKQSQYDQLNDGDWEASLAALKKSYASFVKKNGQLFQNTAYMQKVKVDELDEEGAPTGNKIDDEEVRRRFPLQAKLRDDPECTLVNALENFNEDTGEITESGWLSKRTLGAPAKAEVQTASDALLSSLDSTGVVDIPHIADLLSITEQEAIDALGTMIYEDPAQGWQMADEYLSGNVKKKLDVAEEAHKSDKRYARNIEALKAVQPTARAPGDITPQIGMNWIPGEVYSDFIKELAGVEAKVEYVERTHDWVISNVSRERTTRATVDWGVGDRENAAWLLEKALSGSPIRLNKSVSDGNGGSTLVFDADRTEGAQQKRDQMREEFRSWLFKDAARADKLVTLYNDKFNTTVQRKFDGRHLTLPGTSKLFNIFDHVKRGAWRVIQSGNTYLAHAVGSGKTFEMVISAMEQKRLGKIKKPMIIVPGHMLQQFASEWLQLYPTARLMVADEQGFHTDNRRKFVSRVAMSDLDGVIMTHSSFKLLDLDPEFKQKMIDQELEYMRASLEEAGGNLDDIGNKKVRKEPKIKRIEAQIEKLEQELSKAMSSEGKDKNVRFDEMGVDFLYVDEAHLYRKLSFATNRQMKGIDPAGSQMAWDLFMKTRWLAEKNPDRYMVMASGTAITNTTAELYTVQRFMAPQVLEDNGLSRFDDWAAQFGEESTEIEATSSGKYEPVTRFSNFVNVGEMTQMFRDFADVLNEDHLAALLGDKRPKVAGGARKSVITPKTDSYVKFQEEDLIPRIQASKNWKPSKDQPNNPDPIININTDARLAAIDMRFMEPGLPNDPSSKLNHLIDGVIRIYKETENHEYLDKQGKAELIKGSTQMVFFESGFGRQAAINRGFSARAWMEKRLRDAGIPTSQVAFMEDYKKSSAKLKLFGDVNSGKIRVLVGSSAAMGTGVNAQQRLIALHHLDAPMVPAVLEQREGRIVRQGNKNPIVQIYAYSMFGSFDENQWGMLARKKFFIEQAMSGDPNIRSIEDVGEVSQLQMAAALVAENPFVIQLAGAKAEVEKLTRLYRNHEEQRARMKDDYAQAGRTIEFNEKALPVAEKEAAKVSILSGDNFTAKSDGKEFTKRKEWGESVLSQFKALSDKLQEKPVKVGEISGFDVMFAGHMYASNYSADVSIPLHNGNIILAHDPLTDPVGLALRSVNALVELSRRPAQLRNIIKEAQDKRDSLVTRLESTFPLAEQLANKLKDVDVFEAQMLAYGQKSDEEEKSTEEPQEGAGATAALSRGAGGGMSVRDLKAMRDRIAARMDNLHQVNVLESPEQAPKALQNHIRNAGAWDDVEGATHDGEIYLFASGLASEERAEFVLAVHEVTHLGLRGKYGMGLDAVLQNIWLSNKQVRKEATALRERNGLSSNLEAVEEVMADMPNEALVKLKGWRKLVMAVRNWFSKHGFDRTAEKLDGWLKSGMTEQQKADFYVSDVIRQAREWVRTGKRAEGKYGAGTRLANTPGAMFSRAIPSGPVEQRADAIIADSAATWRPVDAVVKAATKLVRIDRLTSAMYDKAGALLDRYVPEHIKAGLVSDYGIPEAVIDRRVLMTGRMKQQIRGAGDLIDKLATLTRAESRVAYEWMNNTDLQAAAYFEAQLPPESLKVMSEVKALVDKLSREAVMLGQLDPDAFQRNRFEYLRRSYAKHTAELTAGEAKSRGRAISIMGDQYKGRGMSEAVTMAKVKNVAPDWWGRKLQQGKADTDMKGERFIRLERRAPNGQGTIPLVTIQGPGNTNPLRKGKLLEVTYWPAAEPIPTKLSSWEQAGTWEVRDTKGADLIMWRDFTKQEREAMGEIDEARYAIAKTLHGMIHDVETGQYLEWLATKYAAKDASHVTGILVQASDRLRDTFGKDEWVQVPDTKIPGTSVQKYGLLSGRYLPGAIWNDVRQTVGFKFEPFGETYAAILSAWKTSKALALDTPIPTPNGWVTMGEVRVGDSLFDENGNVCIVMGATEVQHDRKCYEVAFSDGTKIVADAEHRWFTIRQGHPGVRTTDEIRATLKEKTRGDANHKIPVAAALELPDVDLPIPPYALGAWLGDGDTSAARLSVGGDDLDEMLENLRESGVRCGRPRKDKRNNVYTVQIKRGHDGCCRGHAKSEQGEKGCRICNNERRRMNTAGVPYDPVTNQHIQAVMRDIGLLGNKHIPAEYLRASEDQRRALLHGLMDTDGHVDKRGMCAFTTTLPALRDGVLELVRSLGYKPTLRNFEPECNGKKGRVAWVVAFKSYSDKPAFSLSRKAARLHNLPARPQRSQTRQIVSITPVKSVPVRCIAVSSKSRLYLAGAGMVPTHNTALSPAVHTNNVMANMVMADWHDVTAGHVLKALRLILAASDRKGKGIIGRAGNVAATAGIADREAAQHVMNRFSDSGGNIGTWATTELQKEQLEPLLQALEKEIGLLGQTQPAQVGTMVALQKFLQLQWPSAWAAFKPTMVGNALTTEAKNMLNLYESEDQVFRLAAWLRAKEEGATDMDAGKAARKSFLDYNINAPWVQAARKTVFPFAAFTYRAVPMLIETIAKKPWKLLKLAGLAGALNALSYAHLGGDGDEEDERRYMPDEKSGRVLGLVPKLIRMPWNDANGSPVFLDIRRFVPVGDILDSGQSHSAIPLIPSLVPGGVLSLLGELVLNRSQFTGKNITQDTDTAVEQAGKVIDHLYKAFAPNLIILPGTYAFDGVVNASKGKTDTFGREQSTPAAVASSFGVKLGSYPTDVLEENAIIKLNMEKSEIEMGISRLDREFQRNGIGQDEYERKVDAQIEKKLRLIEQFREKGN